MKAYSQPLEQLLKQLETDINVGLHGTQVAERQKKYGYNTLPEPLKKSFIILFLHQFQNPLIYILLLAATLIFLLGNHLDAFIISGVLFFNATVGTIQERRASSILARLQRFAQKTVAVLREGTITIINIKELVPGDIVELHEGDQVPADMRVIESNQLSVDEALLTGESIAVTKNPDTLQDTVPIYARDNMLFSGTSIVLGTGRAVVVATGSSTELGKLQSMAIEESEVEIPLKQELDRLSYWILIFIIAQCLVLLAIGLWTGKSFIDLMTTLTALFICVIPEGLPLVLTIVLVTGAYRMALKKILIKHLPAVDSLGRVQLIMIDKTGTLTRNELMVKKVALTGQLLTVSGQGYHPEGNISSRAVDAEQLTLVALACHLLNKSHVRYDAKTELFALEGDPLEAALDIFAKKVDAHIDKSASAFKLIYEIPFSSEYKYHAAFFEKENEGWAFIIGSPEVIMHRCSDFFQNHQALLNDLLAQGLRVVAVGYKKIPLQSAICPNENQVHHIPHQQRYASLLDKDVTLLAFVGVQDAIRAEVTPVIKQARDAGLRIVMVTGDHPQTARYVAKNVGIMEKEDELFDASKIYTIAEFKEAIAKKGTQITAYARVTPDYKLELVHLYRERGLVVAMTGDGVNDVPSIVAADVGIAMGQIGTEVAKQAADVVLLDDSFVNVIAAIREGRHIFYALRRVVLYFFATNMGEVLVIFFAFILRQPIPILAAQILWLNLVTDGFLDIALSMEPQEKDILQKKGLWKGARLIDRGQLLKIIYMAIPMGIGSMAVFHWYYHHDSIEKARTMTLITMAMYQWFNAWNCRSDTLSVFQIGWFSNRWLIAATALVAILQVLVVSVPILQFIFKTVPLDLFDLKVVLLITAPLFIIEELRKWIVRSRS